MTGKGNEAYEKFDREMSAKFGDLVQRSRRESLWDAFMAPARALEFSSAPEQELADDYERNDHQ